MKAVKPLTNNARFWTWLNDGWVKLTVREGQFLMWGRTGRTDEGWSSEQYCWNWDGSELSALVVNDGRDCDGRMTHTGTFWAHREHLRAWAPATGNHDCLQTVQPAANLFNGRPIMTVDWQRGLTGQRDYSAEAANY